MNTGLHPKWNGRMLIPSIAADREMAQEGLSLQEVAGRLETADKCGKRRKEGILELCFQKGNRRFKIVLAESFRYSDGEIVFLIIHLKSVSW